MLSFNIESDMKKCIVLAGLSEVNSSNELYDNTSTSRNISINGAISVNIVRIAKQHSELGCMMTILCRLFISQI